MFSLLIIVSVVVVLVDIKCAEVTQVVVPERTFVYNRFKYDEAFNLTLNNTVEHFLDFDEDNELYQGYPTRVHVSSNESITGNHPLFITATQQKGVSSWELPLVVQTSKSTIQFDDMSRTLCPHDAGPNITTVNRPFMQITTSSPVNVTISIKLRRVEDFFVEVDHSENEANYTWVSLKVKPSTPKYYYFSFDSAPWNVTGGGLAHKLFSFNYTIPKSVILIIESDNDLCAVVSIQNNSCPVFDNEADVLYQGYHLTMTTKGGITLTQSMFPSGFYIVFIVKETDDECTGASETATVAVEGGRWEEGVRHAGGQDRLKSFRFRVIATISYKEYLTAALVALALTLLFYILAVMLTYCQCVWKEEVLVVIPPLPTAGPSMSGLGQPGTSEQDLLPSSEAGEGAPLVAGSRSGSESECETHTDTVRTVAHMCTAKQSVQARRSDRYFWSALTVAVIYALPVVQLLVTYQNMVFQTGNQDLCYYNFLCAHPLLGLSDFNHVFSNFAYAALGAAFIAQVRRRQKRGHSELGIPQHHGLFYSMGLALMMEGVLSACYHLCPNKMNFQFDSSFMYVIAVLCMVQLYQNRHPDVNARAHVTYMLLAVVMAIGVCGIMYPSIGFWVIFTILHLTACTYLTLQIYYFGRLKLEWSLARRSLTALRANRAGACIPGYRARAALLALANVANWALAIYGVVTHRKDVAKHLLAILMGNAILYMAFYVCMKLLHRERIAVYTWLYFVLAHAAWFVAGALFLQSKTKWSQTPAGSRVHNAQCSAFRFYDSHDLWHMCSAAALFLSFNVLLTIDDLLANTNRENIPVF